MRNDDNTFCFKQVYSLKIVIGIYLLKVYGDYKKLQKAKSIYELFKNEHKVSYEALYLFFPKSVNKPARIDICNIILFS